MVKLTTTLILACLSIGMCGCQNAQTWMAGQKGSVKSTQCRCPHHKHDPCDVCSCPTNPQA